MLVIAERCARLCKRLESYLKTRLVGLLLVGSIVDSLTGASNIALLLAGLALGRRGLAALRSFGRHCGGVFGGLFVFKLYGQTFSYVSLCRDLAPTGIAS